jgi:hypothetical protein
MSKAEQTDDFAPSADLFPAARSERAGDEPGAVGGVERCGVGWLIDHLMPEYA